MKKDSLFLAILLGLGILLGILYFINPNLIVILKNRIIFFLKDIWIITKNKIINFGI